MSYHLAEISGNLLSFETWERIGKFLAVNVGIGIIVAIVMYLIITMLMPKSVPLAVVAMIIAALMGHAFVLSAYENWRSCSFPNKA
jgi:hypothetical protein